MELSTFYPLIMVVALMVAGIALLRIFFTLWEPIERLVNGDRRTTAFTALKQIELEGKAVDIHLKSGVVLERILVLSYCSPTPRVSFDSRCLMKAQMPNGAIAYVNVAEVAYLKGVEQPIETTG